MLPLLNFENNLIMQEYNQFMMKSRNRLKAIQPAINEGFAKKYNGDCNCSVPIHAIGQK